MKPSCRSRNRPRPDRPAGSQAQRPSMAWRRTQSDAEQREGDDRQHLIRPEEDVGRHEKQDGGRHDQTAPYHRLARSEPLQQLLPHRMNRTMAMAYPSVSSPACCAVSPPPTWTSVIATMMIPATALSSRFETVAPV